VTEEVAAAVVTVEVASINWKRERPVSYQIF